MTEEVHVLMDDAYQRYRQLEEAKKEMVLAHPSLGRFSKRLHAIWLFTTQFIGAPGYVHHAGLVAKMVGYAYESKDDKLNFRLRVLEKHGTRGVDWDNVAASSIFSKIVSPGDPDDLEIPVPGLEETVIISKGSNRSTFPMVTEKFSRVLLAKSNKPIGREYIEFLLAVHDVILSGLTLKRPALPSWHDEVEHKRRLLDLQEREVEISRKKALAERERANVERERYEGILQFMRGAGMDDDERGRLFMVDMARTFVARMSRDPLASVQDQLAIMDAEPVPEELTISEEAVNYRGRPLRMNEASAVGKILAKLYREAHAGSAPPKRRQYVDGAPRLVNSYTTADRELMHRAFDEFFRQQ